MYTDVVIADAMCEISDGTYGTVQLCCVYMSATASVQLYSSRLNLHLCLVEYRTTAVDA